MSRRLKGKLHSCQCAVCSIKVNFVVSRKLWCFRICFGNNLNTFPLGAATPVWQTLHVLYTAAECVLQLFCCLLCGFSAVNTAQERVVTLSNVQSAAEQLSDEPSVVVVARLCCALEALDPPCTPFNYVTSFKQEIFQFMQKSSVAQHLRVSSCRPAVERTLHRILLDYTQKWCRREQ